MSGLEWLTLVHVASFVVAGTWAFGGQADFVRHPLALWGSLAPMITVAALRDRQAWREGWTRPVFWMWPFLAFNVLVLVAARNPSFIEVRSGADIMLVNTGGHRGWPSSAQPVSTLEGLWLFDATWLSCFNLVLVTRHRRSIRWLLVVLVVNAVVLAVFGTIQKLGGASGLFFGAVPTRQKYFFASFVYHNHWGAFALLAMSTAMGLIWHFVKRHRGRDLLHSPTFTVLVAVFLIAATIPLSGSRSTTMLMVAFAAGAFLHWTKRLIDKRRYFHESSALPLTAAILVVVLATAGVWYVARDTIKLRFALTESQISEMHAQGGIGSRATLYHDTVRMAEAKPWFGWGMASYPHVFMLYNTQESVIDRLPVFYHDAHSDWLQSLAEHGIIGSLLLALLAIVPLARTPWRDLRNSLSAYLLTGCLVVLLYAWVEFPFGNFAVVLVWWTLFFSAVQYARMTGLTRNQSGSPDFIAS